MTVQRGTSLGLIGPNGAGKSTALKLMARILTPDRGRLYGSAGILSLQGERNAITGRQRSRRCGGKTKSFPVHQHPQMISAANISAATVCHNERDYSRPLQSWPGKHAVGLPTAGPVRPSLRPLANSAAKYMPPREPSFSG